jgi:hypothetical protein
MLCELPLDVQMAALVCAIVERRPQAIRALVSMSAVMAVMANARCLSETNRIALAEVVRACADEIERGHEIVRV